MNTPILHHYPLSPFAEKARLMLGYKGLAWRSVTLPVVMPKPDLLALTGGYRRTPVLQIGADIYCDTALIADVLEHLAPSPTLYPEPHKGLARIVAQWADSSLFWAAMGVAFAPQTAAEVLAGQPAEVLQVFADDRARMRGGAPRLRPPDAAAALHSQLRRLSDMLHRQAFLLGDAPSVADFAACHPLWFLHRVPALRALLAPTPAVGAWLERLAAIGHGSAEPVTAQAAIDEARAATPACVLPDSGFQDEHGIALGSAVRVRAESFGTEASEGLLVAATRTHYSLERTDARAGTVQVHFPRLGYVLEAAQAQTPATSRIEPSR